MKILELTPVEPLDEAELQIQVSNLIGEVHEALSGVVDQAVLAWAQQANMVDNAFMRDRLKDTIYTMALGFMLNVRAHQLTPEHVADYFRISSEPNPPDSKKPEPLNE